MKVIHTGEAIQYYDDSNKLRAEETLEYTKWYDSDGTTLNHQETANGTIVYVGNYMRKTAEFSSSRCGVYCDATIYQEFTATGLSIVSMGSRKFSFNNKGVCAGHAGDSSYTLDPSALTGDATFQSTTMCTNNGSTTVQFLRSDAA